MNVPLHVALRGIEKSFDSWESRPRKRTVKGLLYCQEEVEAQFAEWLESRIGAADTVESEENGSQSKEALPFSRDAILEHLERGKLSLDGALSARRTGGDDELSDALERAVSLLSELEQDFTSAKLPETRKLEQSLSGVERMLSDALRLVISTEQLDVIESEIKEQLKPYRKQMDKAVYQQTFDNLLLKRLREQFGIPRLSLFYL
jgi:hypothetical protein